MSRLCCFASHLLPVSREKRLQSHLFCLYRSKEVERRRLLKKMEKRRRLLRGDDRNFWRVKGRQMKACWRQNRQKLPTPLRKQGWRWMRDHLRSRNYLALLRLYLVLLAARDSAFQVECNGLLGKWE